MLAMIRALSAGIFLFALCAELTAQTLSIPQSTAKPGGAGSLLLRLDSPTPAALAIQWRLVFPKGITVANADIVSGSAAESAAKALTCVLVERMQMQVFACVLAGGKQAIGRGTLATVRYRVSPGVSNIADKVKVESVIAITADEKKLNIPAVEGAILVQ
jgi:hypothetical protein